MRGGISIGVMGGWGGRRGWGWPRGRYPRGGWYNWYDPWGWNVWVPMGTMFMAYPMAFGPGPYREGSLVAVLRERESGYVAWVGRVAADRVGTPHLSQRRVQAVVDRLLSTLR